MTPDDGRSLFEGCHGYFPIRRLCRYRDGGPTSGGDGWPSWASASLAAYGTPWRLGTHLRRRRLAAVGLGPAGRLRHPMATGDPPPAATAGRRGPRPRWPPTAPHGGWGPTSGGDGWPSWASASLAAYGTPWRLGTHLRRRRLAVVGLGLAGRLRHPMATGDPPPAATAGRRGPRPRWPPTAPHGDWGPTSGGDGWPSWASASLAAYGTPWRLGTHLRRRRLAVVGLGLAGRLRHPMATGDPPPAATASRRGPRPRWPPTAPHGDWGPTSGGDGWPSWASASLAAYGTPWRLGTHLRRRRLAVVGLGLA